ncbi:MAG: glycolate oxidase subunit GlcF [Rhodobacteraceae bacterium]|nr:glycolate oxidase subunit GlcF [Paracoccaceae bacterium]
METRFTEQQLKDPAIARSNDILRTCVHCGFCTATCPTYQLLGDELDSPRGRIYLIRNMLESGQPADRSTVLHIDRCLSCLACMTTCPSGVHYMHLVDHARSYIEETYRRPLFERFLRRILVLVLPHPTRFRLSLLAAKLARPFISLLPSARLRAMLRLTPDVIPPVSRNDDPQLFAAETGPIGRVVLATGCAQRALNTDINDATIRLLRRLGYEVVIAEGSVCCGALPHHMGRTAESHDFAERNIRAWQREIENGAEAIIINASGCGTTIKDYGHMFRHHRLAEAAAQVSRQALDISEFLARAEIRFGPAKGIRVAYHAACSLQHGQQIRETPKELLRRAGFEVVEPHDSHLCCGSAGTYNIMQPEIADRLKQRKVASLEAVAPELIATGNIGCMMQIGSATGLPVLHIVELLDWATGGPKPPALTPPELRRSG